MSPTGLEDVWRHELPHVLGALVGRYGDFDDCEDAAQEAFLAAVRQWPLEGVPDRPRAWLLRVASRRLIDHRRSESARDAREQVDGLRRPADALRAPAADEPASPAPDDTLSLLVMCCHPALSQTSQVALTLRAVAGLTTAQIAAAFLVPQATIAQRISRAKATLRRSGATFHLPAAPELPHRIAAVLQVLYLVFNEGYTTSGGPSLLDVWLTAEALRLTRMLHQMWPDHTEAAGALALMVLTNSRTPTRTDAVGNLVPLAEQNRSRWDRAAIAEGVALLEQTLPRGHTGPFQLQAAIAAVHAEAPSWEETDWLQITMLYRMLQQQAPSPTVTLNLAVAVGMAHGPQAGLSSLEPLTELPEMQRGHRFHAVRAHLLELTGRRAEAADAYALAARRTSSIPEQRYLNTCAARAGSGPS